MTSLWVLHANLILLSPVMLHFHSVVGPGSRPQQVHGSQFVDIKIMFDIKSRWRHNWKSAQAVNSHLVCDPTIRQPGFDLPRQQWSLLNRFRAEQGHCSACRRKWRLTLFCVLVARPRRCPTLSNPVPWQNWMAAHLGYTLRMKMLFRGWPLTSYGSWHAYEKKNTWTVCVQLCWPTTRDVLSPL